MLCPTHHAVAFHLLSNGEKQVDPSSSSTSSVRQLALSLLCEMNPAAAARVRARCVEALRMPSLALALTCDMDGRGGEEDSDDLVGFMSGLLLGSDPQVRSWISFFIR